MVHTMDSSDLENVLTMSQLVGKSAEERNTASMMLDILAGTKNKTAAEVAVEVVTSRESVDKKCFSLCLQQTLPDEPK